MATSLRNSLAVRFLLAGFLTVLLTMVMSTVISSVITTRAMNESAQRQLQRQVGETIDILNLWLETQRKLISSLALEKIYGIALEDSFKGRAAQRSVENRFSRMALSFSYYNSLNLLNLDGKVLASDLLDEDQLLLDVDQEYVTRAIAGEMIVTPVFENTLDQNHIFAMYSPIYYRGTMQGILYVEYSLNYLNELFVLDRKAGESGYAFLLDENNLVISHPDARVIGETFFQQSEFMSSDGRLNSGFFDYTYKKVHRKAYAGYISELGCTLVLGVPSEELQKPGRQLVMVNALITMFSSLVAIGILYSVWQQQISTPITKLIRGIQDFRQERFHQPLELNVHNELRTVADSFNEMVVNIKNSTVSISELREQQRNLQKILDSMSIGVLIIGENNDFRMINSALLQIAGSDSLAEFELHREKSVLLERLEKEPYLELEFGSSVGTNHWLLRAVQEIQLSGEEVLLLTFVDISQQKQAEMDRQSLEQDLQASSRLKAIGTLAAGIAHEINTPIQYIGDNVRFLEEATEDLMVLLVHYDKLLMTLERQNLVPGELELVRQKAEEIDLEFLHEEIPSALKQSFTGLEDVARIVLAMKTFSHQGEGKVSNYDLNQGINNTLAVSHNRWKLAADVNLDLDDALPELNCYTGEINQVILNLVVNAADAIIDLIGENSAEKGKISIRTYQENDFAYLEVADTGKGMTDEVKGKVFDPFFTTKEVGKGTGQGLSLTQRIVVERHHGTIEVESEYGKGSTFTVKLPLHYEGKYEMNN